jgi:hypothetical protein
VLLLPSLFRAFLTIASGAKKKFRYTLLSAIQPMAMGNANEAKRPATKWTSNEATPIFNRSARQAGAQMVCSKKIWRNGQIFRGLD